MLTFEQLPPPRMLALLDRIADLHFSNLGDVVQLGVLSFRRRYLWIQTPASA